MPSFSTSQLVCMPFVQHSTKYKMNKNHVSNNDSRFKTIILPLKGVCAKYRASNRDMDEIAIDVKHIMQKAEVIFENEHSTMLSTGYPNVYTHCLSHQDIQYELGALYYKCLIGINIGDSAFDNILGKLYGHLCDYDAVLIDYLGFAANACNYKILRAKVTTNHYFDEQP